MSHDRCGRRRSPLHKAGLGGLDLGDVLLGDLHDANVGVEHRGEGEHEAADHQEDGEPHLRHPHGIADGHSLRLEAVLAPATQGQTGHQEAEGPDGHEDNYQAGRRHFRWVPEGEGEFYV